MKEQLFSEKICLFILFLRALYFAWNSILTQDESSNGMFTLGLLFCFNIQVVNTICHIVDLHLFRTKASAGLCFLELIPVIFYLGSGSNAFEGISFFSQIYSCTMLLFFSLKFQRITVPALCLYVLMFLCVVKNYDINFAVLLKIGSIIAVSCLMLYFFSVNLPKSFTFGELVVVSQIILSFVYKLHLIVNMENMNYDVKIAFFIYVLFVSVASVTFVVAKLCLYSKLGTFLMSYLIAAFAALSFLYLVFDFNAVIWLIYFICENERRMLILASWALLFAFSLAWTMWEHTSELELNMKTVLTVGIQQDNPSKNIQCTKNTEKKLSFMWKRKIFHLLVILVYIPGLVFDLHLLLVASSACFAVFIILEACRALRVPHIGQPLHKILKTFVDDRDSGYIFVTHLYLLLGLSVPLWISHEAFEYSPTTHIKMFSGVLSLGIGDTVACLAGVKWGVHKWPGTSKTIEGTASSIVAQLLFVYFIVSYDFVHVEYYNPIVIGVIVSALVEAYTDQIDNLVLPLVLFPFLSIS